MRSHTNRGVSFGTILGLMLTAIVVFGMVYVLERFSGRVPVPYEAHTTVRAMSVSRAPQHVLISTPAPTASLSALQPISTAPPAASADAELPAMLQPVAEESITLTFGGTVSVENSVRKSCYYSTARVYDFDELFDLLQGRLQSDLTFLPVENLIDDTRQKEPYVSSQLLLSLRRSGVNAVGLGYAGVLNAGTPAALSTAAAVKAAGLLPFGISPTEADSTVTARILEINGVRVAVLHFNDNISAASMKKLTTAGLEWVAAVSSQAVEQIGLARTMGADLVIVSINWGKTGARAPTQKQRALARSMADAGADVIVGAGSRVIHPAEWLTRSDGSRTLCCYSLGNLLSDSRTDNGVAGMLLHLTFVSDGVSIRLSDASYSPTYIWHYKQDKAEHYRIICSLDPPDGMEDDQLRSMRKALERVSNQLGSGNPLHRAD